MWRYIHTLFRRKAVFLIPSLVVPLVAVALLAGTQRQYQVNAIAWVEPSTLLVPIALRNTQDANAREAQRLREWLSTDSFRLGLLDAAGLTEPARNGAWPPPSRLQTLVDDVGLSRVDLLRPLLRALGLVPSSRPLEAALKAAGESIKVTSEGNNLLHIRYLGGDPSVAKGLVEGTVSLYRERSLQQRTQDVQQSIDFYARQLQLQEQRLQEASSRLQDFLRARPAPSFGPRPADESAALDQLRQEFQLEETLYGNVLRTLESVRIDGEAIASNQQQRIQIVDPPSEPTPASLGLKGLTLMLLTGLVLGALVGGVGVVTLTWLDSSVRSREDVSEVVDAPAHLHLPHAPSEAKHWPSIGQLLARDV